MKIKFDIESAYGDSDKYIKRKINKYGDKVNTHFHGKKVPKENTSYKYLLLIMQDSVVKVNKKYYTQTLLEECIYEIKNNKMGSLINDDVEPSLFDNETNNESSALRERCPNTEFFSGLYFPVYWWNTGKYRPQKLRIWTLFTQWWLFCQ